MLKLTMCLNAMSCAFFGGLFVLAGGSVAAFLGDPPTWLVYAIGAALLLNAAHISYEVRKVQPANMMVIYFVIADALWVAATFVLVSSGIYVTSPHGIFVALAVAALVAAFAVGQALFSSHAFADVQQESATKGSSATQSNGTI